MFLCVDFDFTTFYVTNKNRINAVGFLSVVLPIWMFNLFSPSVLFPHSLIIEGLIQFQISTAVIRRQHLLAVQ